MTSVGVLCLRFAQSKPIKLFLHFQSNMELQPLLLLLSIMGIQKVCGYGNDELEELSEKTKAQYDAIEKALKEGSINAEEFQANAAQLMRKLRFFSNVVEANKAHLPEVNVDELIKNLTNVRQEITKENAKIVSLLVTAFETPIQLIQGIKAEQDVARKEAEAEILDAASKLGSTALAFLKTKNVEQVQENDGNNEDIEEIKKMYKKTKAQFQALEKALKKGGSLNAAHLKSDAAKLLRKLRYFTNVVEANKDQLPGMDVDELLMDLNEAQQKLTEKNTRTVGSLLSLIQTPKRIVQGLKTGLNLASKVGSGIYAVKFLTAKGAETAKEILGAASSLGATALGILTGRKKKSQKSKARPEVEHLAVDTSDGKPFKGNLKDNPFIKFNRK